MAKRGIDKFHGKHRLITQALHKKYIKETGNALTYSEFVTILETSMEEVQKWVLSEPIGFQLTPQLGNLAVNKFKPGAKFKTYINTSLGPVPNHNLHTGGNAYRIQWFHARKDHDSRQPYWFFKANRNFNRSLATVLKGSARPIFNSYMQSQFITKSK
jgi:hypothetical protein